MKTQYYTTCSLDGFIATEDDSVEWLSPLGNPSESSYPEFIADVGAIAIGSATYEWMQRNAEQVQAETGSLWPYSQPTWVFTKRSLERIPGADIRFFSGDARIAHAEMQAAANEKISGLVAAVIWLVSSMMQDCWTRSLCSLEP